jgi:glycerophosphoryl diester phosphodiesterase
VSEEVAIVGHRGWPARYPENTLDGFLAAAEVADAVELDVRRCSDGRLVVSHDPVLAGHVICETPWSTLCELDLGDGIHPALLDEVLAALPGTPIQLEVKNWFTDPGFEPDHRIALETAGRARPEDMVTCFNPESLAVVARTYPDVMTGLAVQAPLRLEDGLAICRDAGHVALIPDHRLIGDELEADIAVYAWTVNSEPRARELVVLGVDGIITDDPKRMSEALGSVR